MTTGVLWLRVGYWMAAIADFAVAVLVLMPERMGLAAYAYPMGLMAAVAFSWGVLLLLADRKPAERRWVVVPTMLVVALLGGVALHAGRVGLIPFGRATATAAVSAAVLVVLAIGYRKSSSTV